MTDRLPAVPFAIAYLAIGSGLAIESLRQALRCGYKVVSDLGIGFWTLVITMLWPVVLVLIAVAVLGYQCFTALGRLVVRIAKAPYGL